MGRMGKRIAVRCVCLCRASECGVRGLNLSFHSRKSVETILRQKKNQALSISVHTRRNRRFKVVASGVLELGTGKCEAEDCYHLRSM